MACFVFPLSTKEADLLALDRATKPFLAIIFMAATCQGEEDRRR